MDSRNHARIARGQAATAQSPRFIPVSFRPTDEQIQIQIASCRNLIVEANAGAAKTTTLALRIGEALARGGRPEEIIALAFTDEAREVLRKRLVEVGISPKLASLVRVETFDSFAKAILRDFEGCETPELSDEHMLAPHAVRAIEQVSEKFGGQFNYLQIETHSLAVSQFLGAQQTIKARMAVDQDLDCTTHEDLAEAIGVTLTHLLTFYEYERNRLRLFDEAKFRGPFDATYDLARYVNHLPEVKGFLPSFRTIVCDELHDMNEVAFRIIIAVLENGVARRDN